LKCRVLEVTLVSPNFYYKASIYWKKQTYCTQFDNIKNFEVLSFYCVPASERRDKLTMLLSKKIQAVTVIGCILKKNFFKI